MANEYGELSTLRKRVGIEPDDTTRDDELAGALGAASRGIDDTCGRRFYLDATATQRTYRVTGRAVCEDDGDVLLVDDIGNTTGLVIETGSGASWTAVSGVEYVPDNALTLGRPITGLLRVNGSWGLTTSRVRVAARWGWPAVPAAIAEAALIQAARLYKRKDSAEGILGSAEWGVVRLSRRDPDVWNLIEPFILPGF